MSKQDDKIEVENVNTPGRVTRVNRAKYEAMRGALLPALPKEAPGMTVADAKAALLADLSPELFPGGETSGWWLKTVQLDLEAKGILARSPTKPLRIYRTGKSALSYRRASRSQPPRISKPPSKSQAQAGINGLSRRSVVT